MKTGISNLFMGRSSVVQSSIQSIGTNNYTMVNDPDDEDFDDEDEEEEDNELDDEDDE